MRKTHSKLAAILSLGMATLLLASCAQTGEIEMTSEPESQVTQSPGASESTSEAVTSPDPETKTSKSPTASEESTNEAGNYISYKSFAASEDQYSDSKVVLFFNAVWCSTCKQARDNFESSLEQIPENLTIVVVDFDNSIELRKKYGVSVQHTFVEIDNAGEAVGKWSGSVTVAGIVEQLS